MRRSVLWVVLLLLAGGGAARFENEVAINGSGVADTAILSAARSLYNVTNINAYAWNSTDFHNAFPNFDLYAVVELTRHPAPVHAMAWSATLQSAWDATKDFNSILTTAGATITSASDATRYASALARLSNSEFQVPRGVLNASDSSWLGRTVNNATATPLLPSGWNVTLSTWSDENGVLANWTILLSTSAVTSSEWRVVAEAVADYKPSWEAISLREGTVITNTYTIAPPSYALQAVRGSTTLALPSGVLSQSYSPNNNATNFDNSTWDIEQSSSAGNITTLSNALLNASVWSYRWQVDRNNGTGPCANHTNPNSSWGLESRDNDCHLKLRVFQSASPFCGVCVEAGNETIIYVTERLQDLFGDIQWYRNASRYTLDDIAKTVVAHAHLVNLVSQTPQLLPDVHHANLPGPQLLDNQTLDVEHFAVKSIYDPVFRAVEQELRDSTGYVAVSPAFNGNNTLFATFTGNVTPAAPLDLLPFSWNLSFSTNLSARNLTGSFPENYTTMDHGPRLSSPDGIGPGSFIKYNETGASGFCTANFIWADNASPPNLYLGTAGHCAAKVAPASVCRANCVFGGITGYLLPNTDPGPVYVNLGTTDLYVTRDLNGGVYNENDFAIYLIPPEEHAHIRYDVPTWGGPVGVSCPTLDVPPMLAAWYGNGIFLGETVLTKARAGFAYSCDSSSIPHEAAVLGCASSGDSGSPLVSSSIGPSGSGSPFSWKAIGILDAIFLVPPSEGLPPGGGCGVLIGPTIAQIESVMLQRWQIRLSLMCRSPTGGGRVCG